MIFVDSSGIEWINWLVKSFYDNSVFHRRLVRMNRFVRFVTKITVALAKRDARSNLVGSMSPRAVTYHRFDKPLNISPIEKPIPITSMDSTEPTAMEDMCIPTQGIWPICPSCIDSDGSISRHEQSSSNWISTTRIPNCTQQWRWLVNSYRLEVLFLTLVSIHFIFKVQWRSMSLSLHTCLSNLVFTSIFHWVGLGFFWLLIIYFMVVELQCLFEGRWSYFRRLWSYIELGLVICAWLAAITYLYLWRESNSLHRFFLEKIHLKFVNLQRMVLLDDLFTSLLGLMAFLATLRFLRLCHLHPRLVLFVATLEHVRRPLLHFSMMFSIVFITLVCLFYGLFASTMERCSSVWRTIQMIFEMALLNVDGKEFDGVASTLGPLVFTLFVLLMIFVCRNMFVSIVMDSIRNVRQTNNTVDPMFTFMYHRFRRCIGARDEPKSLSDCPTPIEPIHYVTWFESYPEQMERLVQAVDRIIHRWNHPFFFFNAIFCRFQLHED